MKTKLFNALSLAVIMAMLFTSLALADQVNPDGDLVTTGNQTTISLGNVSPGAVISPSISFTLECKSNKHADDAQKVIIAFQAVAPGGSSITRTGGGTFSGASLTATDTNIGPDGNGTIPTSWPDDGANCGGVSVLADNGDSAVSITAPTTPGTYTYGVRYGLSLSPAGFEDSNSLNPNQTTVNFTLTVPSNTAPSVSVTGVTNGSSYEFGAVPAAVCQVTDIEDGNSSFAATLSAITGSLSSYGLGSQTASCSYTDNGGLSDSDSVTYSIVDTAAPTVTITPDRVPDYGDWYNSSIHFTVSGDDGAGSGVASCTAAFDYDNPDSAIASVNASCTDNAGNVNSASYDFQYDGTLPEISYSISPDRPASGWWNNASGAPTATFTCDDDTAGVESCEGPHAFGEGENQSYTGIAKDNAGNTASVEVSNIDVDLTAPSITFVSPSTTPWYNTNVTANWNCSDALSGAVSASVIATTSGEGSAQSVTGTCADNAGNTKSDTQFYKVDKTAPTVSASASPAPNGNGWNNSAVTVSFSGSDGLSGIDFCDSPSVLNSEGAGQSASGVCVDKAGNVSDSATASNINIDLTAPTLTWDPGVYADGSVFYFGFVPAWPPNPCVATDALSGPGACTVTGFSTAIGVHTLTATAYDLAGNSKVETRLYEVKAWTLSGFYKPVDMNGVWNTVKGGSTVPFKFEIFAGSTELKLTSYVLGFSAQMVTCPNGNVTTDPIEVLATGGTSLRFDTTGDQFIYNWQTPKLPGRCYVITMKTQDGSTLSANFILK